MIANRFNPLGKSLKTVSAKDYIQDGLIHMYDAIENAGWGVHEDAPTAWKDLINENDLTIGSSGVTFGENFANFVGTMLQNTSVSLGSNESAGEGTKRIEIVFAVDANAFADGVLNGAVLVSGVIAQSGRIIWIGADGTDTLIGNGYYYGKPAVIYPITQGAVITASIPYGSNITTANTFVDGLTQTVKNAAKSIRSGDGNLVVGHNFYGKICAVRIYTNAATADEAFYHATLDKERFGI